MRGVTRRPVQRIGGAASDGDLDDEIAVEEPLELRLAGDSLAVTMRTPGEDERLALGFLLAEGVIRSAADVGTISHCGRPGDEGYGNVIEVVPASGARLDFERVDETRRGSLTSSACGICGRKTIDDLLARVPTITRSIQVPAELLAQTTERLRDGQKNFARTGGVHSAAAFALDGTLLHQSEDVGRHNAVDKVVGALLQRDQLGQAVVLAVSGRAGFEIAQKAAMARIPFVTSVGAASSLAIDLAERAGLTLAAFVRGGRMNLYTHPGRVVSSAR
jgi:FdhD protein